MTLDEAIAKAAHEIDAILEERMDALALKMIACGVDADILPDLLDAQHHVNAAWRVQTLADIRTQLLDLTGWERRAACDVHQQD